MSETTGRMTLKRPIPVKIGGEETEITEIVCRPVEKAKDLLCMDKYDGQMAKTLGLIAHLSNLTFAQVGELHPDDLDVLMRKVEDFT